MITYRAVPLLTLSLLLLIIGYTSSSYELLIIATVPLVYLSLSREFLMRSKVSPEKLVVQRSVSNLRMTEKSSIDISLKIDNKLSKRVRVYVVDPIGEGVTVEEGCNAALASIKPLDSLTINYKLKAERRGRHVLGPLSLFVTDPLGMYSERYELGDRVYIYAFPYHEPIKKVSLKSEKPGLAYGEIKARVIGIGSEFYGIREYIPGDEIRRISWKASARLGKLLSNEYLSERVADFMIVLDSGEDEEMIRYLEAACRIASALVRMLILQGNRVGIVVHGGYRSWVYLSSGNRHVIRINEELCMAKPGRAPDLDFVLSHLLPHIHPHGSHVIIISPLIDEKVIKAVRAIATIYDVTIFTLTTRYVLRPDSHELHIRILDMLRTEMIESITPLAQVIIWDPSSPLLHTLSGVRYGKRARQAY